MVALLEVKTSPYFREMLISGMQVQYGRIAEAISTDPQHRINEKLFFLPKDYLGKTWYRLFMERRLMESDPEEIFTPVIVAGFTCATRAFAGLWFHEMSSQGVSRRLLRHIGLSLTKEERKEISLYYDPLSEEISRLLRQPTYSTRNAIGTISTILMVNVPGFDQGVQKEFALGVQLALRKWRELSSQA